MAQQHGIQELSLKEVQEVEDLLFSVEFDRINRPGRFRSDFLCKIHFSALPRHRGVAIVVMPLLEVCQNTADQGFDVLPAQEVKWTMKPGHYNAMPWIGQQPDPPKCYRL